MDLFHHDLRSKTSPGAQIWHFWQLKMYQFGVCWFIKIQDLKPIVQSTFWMIKMIMCHYLCFDPWQFKSSKPWSLLLPNPLQPLVLLSLAVADQGFSQGVPTLRGHRDMILLNFPKNCMKSRKIWSLRGALQWRIQDFPRGGRQPSGGGAWIQIS